MKKTIMTSAAAALSLAAYAQETSAPGLHYPTQKGNTFIGGDILSASLGSGNGSAYYNVGLSPRAGYFVATDLVLGLELNSSISGFSGYQSLSAGVGVFGRYYFGKALNKDGSLHKLRFFAEGGVSYNIGHTRIEQPDQTYTTVRFNSTTPYMMGGVNYFVTNNIALEAGLSVSHTFYSNYNARPANNDNNLGMRVGLKIFLGRK